MFNRFLFKQTTIDWNRMEQMEDRPSTEWAQTVNTATQVTFKELLTILTDKIDPIYHDKFLYELGAKNFIRIFNHGGKNKAYRRIIPLFEIVNRKAYQRVANWIAQEITHYSDFKTFLRQVDNGNAQDYIAMVDPVIIGLTVSDNIRKKSKRLFATSPIYSVSSIILDMLLPKRALSRHIISNQHKLAKLINLVPVKYIQLRLIEISHSAIQQQFFYKDGPVSMGREIMSLGKFWQSNLYKSFINEKVVNTLYIDSTGKSHVKRLIISISQLNDLLSLCCYKARVAIINHYSNTKRYDLVGSLTINDKYQRQAITSLKVLLSRTPVIALIIDNLCWNKMAINRFIYSVDQLALLFHSLTDLPQYKINQYKLAILNNMTDHTGGLRWLIQSCEGLCQLLALCDSDSQCFILEKCCDQYRQLTLLIHSKQQLDQVARVCSKKTQRKLKQLTCDVRQRGFTSKFFQYYQIAENLTNVNDKPALIELATIS